MYRILPIISLAFVLGCGAPSEKQESAEEVTEVSTEDKAYVKDPHSFAHPDEIAVTHISLELKADFETRTLGGTATHTLLRNSPAEEVHFDIDGLDIHMVQLDRSKVAEYRMGEESPFGQELIVKVEPETESVTIHYTTSPDARAVQWLEPVQTLGKEHPFLFTQGQAILTRTWIPCQDSPGIRVTYDAVIKVPSELMAVMSASNPTEKNESGSYSFEMPQAIPPYLIALAIGDIEFESVGDRTGVYAEPEMLPRSAKELEDMEAMVEAAEGLYGPYRWERYDVIVLPPSFPFGGMENPRLTFATPTIIAGDKSLTSLIAHELAHSWSGNLVTNANWDDFWLNEGFTVYFEYRIMEEVFGADYANMLKKLGLQELKKTVKSMGLQNRDTHLKLNLEGRDPDMGMTDIAYEKGHMFLEMLEETYGRETFDAFLRDYFDTYAFQNMTTERFLEHLDHKLISKYEHGVDVEAWVYGPGLPENTWEFQSERFDEVDKAMAYWSDGKKEANALGTSEWSTHEWLHFIRAIDDDLAIDRMAQLDEAFGFTESTNSEIQGIWYVKAAKTGYDTAFPAMEEFLINVGRRKFLTPIYTALKDNGQEQLAKDIYSKARDNYHSVSKGTMDELLAWEE